MLIKDINSAKIRYAFADDRNNLLPEDFRPFDTDEVLEFRFFTDQNLAKVILKPRGEKLKKFLLKQDLFKEIKIKHSKETLNLELTGFPNEILEVLTEDFLERRIKDLKESKGRKEVLL